MTVGDLYAAAPIASMPTKDRAKELSRYLNDIFYPQQATTADYQSTANILVNEVLNSLGNYEFKDSSKGLGSGISSTEVDMGAQMTSKETFEQLKSVLKKTKGNAENECRRTFSTVQTKLNILKQAIDQLPTPDSTSDLQITYSQRRTLKKNLLEVYNDIVGYLEKCGYNETSSNLKKYFVGIKADGKLQKDGKDSNVTLAHRIYQLDEITNFLVSNPIAVPKTIYGDVLEYSLAALSNIPLSQIPEKVNEMIEHGLNLKEISGVYGGNRKNLGENTSRQVTIGNVSLIYTDEDQKKNPFSDRQGKMDVEFTIPTTGQVYRISAKNWSTTKEFEKMPRDFGHTSVGAALLRTIGPNGLYEHFSPKIVYSNSDSPLLKNSHLIAKHSLLLDILMGYSQKNAYADTVVINDREKKEIKVIAMRQILETLRREEQGIYIQDYNDNIENNWSSFRKNLGYEQIYNELLNYKASLRYSDLVRSIGEEEKFVFGRKNS